MCDTYDEDRRPEDFQLRMDFNISDWQEKMRRVGLAVGDGAAPISLTIEDEVTLSGPIDMDSTWLWDFPSLFDLHVRDNGYAVEVLHGLVKSRQDGPTKTYPCPNLAILQFLFMFDDLPEDWFVVYIKKLLALRPNIMVIDGNRIQCGQKGFGS